MDITSWPQGHLHPTNSPIIDLTNGFDLAWY